MTDKYRLKLPVLKQATDMKEIPSIFGFKIKNLYDDKYIDNNFQLHNIWN